MNCAAFTTASFVFHAGYRFMYAGAFVTGKKG